MFRLVLRSIAGAVAFGGAAAVVLVLIAGLPQAEGLRRAAVARALTHLWGDPVAVRGTVEVELWPRVMIETSDIEALGSDGMSAHVDHLTFATPHYGDLVSGGVSYSLSVEGAQFHVPLDGADDARPGSLLESPIYVLSLLPHLVIRDTVMRFLDAGRGWSFELKVADLKSKRDAGRNVLAADVSLNGQPLTLGFTFDLEVQKGETGLPYGAEIRFASAGTTGGLSGGLDVRAPTARFDRGLVMDLDAEAGSLAQVLMLAGIAPSIDGTGKVRAHLEAERDRLGVPDLDFAVTLADGEHVTVTGRAADLARLEGADLKVVADLDTGAASAVSLRDIVVTRLSGAFRSGPQGMMLDDILVETNAFDQSFREIGPIRVRSVERNGEGQVAFRGISVQAGPNERPVSRLTGDVRDVLRFTGVQLAGSIDLPVASVLALPPVNPDGLGRFVGSLAMSDDRGGLRVDSLAARIEGSDLMQASLGLVLEDLVRPDVATTAQVDARLQIPNYAAFAAAFGARSGFRGPIGFEGRLSGTSDALILDGRTDIGRTQITGTLTSAALPGGRTQVTGTVTSPVVYGDELVGLVRPESQGRGPRRSLAVAGAVAPAGGSRIDLLGTTDADIEISVARLEGGGNSAKGIQARLSVKDGGLRVDPLRIGYLGGVIAAVIVSEGRSVLRIKGSGEGWPLSALIGRRSGISVSGTLRLAFDLTTRTDAAAPLSTLGGTLTAWVGRGRLGTGLLDLAGMGLIGGLFTSSVYNGQTELRCAKVPLVFDKGVGRTNPVLVVHTENVQALGRGTVDLVRNRIDLLVVPRPLSALGGETGHSFTVKGPLNGPSIALASDGRNVRGRYGCDN